MPQALVKCNFRRECEYKCNAKSGISVSIDQPGEEIVITSRCDRYSKQVILSSVDNFKPDPNILFARGDIDNDL